MLLLFISIFPVFVILFYIYRRDKYEREPIGLLIKAFFGGVLSAVVTVLLLWGILPFIPHFNNIMISSFIEAFVEAAIPEELFKMVFLYWIIWNNKEFNEKFDGIVYAVFVSLGFACLENIFYVFGNGIAIGLLRAVLSVPAHALFGVIMGYFFSLAKFEPEYKSEYLIKALFFSILAHGVFDFLLFFISKSASENVSLALVAFVAFFVFVFFLWKKGFKKLKQHSDDSVFRYTDTQDSSVNQ